MDSQLPVLDAEGEVGDLSGVDPAHFRPAAVAFPVALRKTLGVRGKQKGQPRSASPSACRRTWCRLSGRLAQDGRRAWMTPCVNGCKGARRLERGGHGRVAACPAHGSVFLTRFAKRARQFQLRRLVGRQERSGHRKNIL